MKLTSAGLPREGGDPVFQRRLTVNQEAAAYWIVRSSRTMTAEFDVRTKTAVFDVHSSYPPCRGVMISISSPLLSRVCAHFVRGSTSQFNASAKCVRSESS